MTVRAVVRGVGHYLPERVVPNSEFEAQLDTSDAWIQARSGIKQRHFVADGQTTSDMAIEAAKAALKDSDLQSNDIDAVIVATSTADLTFPSVATMVQAGLGMKPALPMMCRRYAPDLSMHWQMPMRKSSPGRPNASW